jgi:uncharacterized membrane protein
MAAVTAIENRQSLPDMRQTQRDSSGVNVGETERWASLIGGTALALYGLARHSPGGTALALAGGSILYRGVTGHCPAYGAMGVSTAATVDQAGRIEKSFTINRSPEEIYRFWRNFENLPRFMKHLESVRVTDGRSHWVAKAPTGQTVQWDAEITDERENERIAWRSLPGADVDNAGSVRFRPAPGGRGTVVTVSMEYSPPGGGAGAALIRLLGDAPERQVEEDLRRFKEVMEAGEIPTIAGQPHG